MTAATMTIFLPYYFAAFALLYLELRGASFAPVWVPRWPAWIWVAGLVVLYAAQLAAVAYAAVAVNVPIAWPSPPPIGVASADVRFPDAFEAALLAIAGLQSYALLGMYRARAGTSRALVFAGMASMIVLSLAAPAFESPDAYAYVGDASLGLHSYAPPARDFAGQFETINRYFMSPLLPAPYGPLWISVVQIVTWPFASLLGKLIALRAFGAVCVVATIAALRAAGVAPRAVAVAALNPALFMQYAGDAHNDAFGLALLVAAAAFARRRSALASAGMLAVAALVKLPFALIGLPALSALRRRTRYACAVTAIAIAVAISWLAGGAAYFRALLVHVPAPGPVYAVNLAVSLVAIVALAAAFARNVRLRSAVWPIAMMSSYVATWYMAYGLPYALARRRVLLYLLLALPIACALIDAKFVRWWTYGLVLPLAVLVCARPRAARR
ncbi:MAG: hypothetical protein JO199_10095 [Candidatus Eremiobacteraeota bacterium]|nr:hypothetical protein [Candidatus Eremiobacteraeota bacterium]